MIVKQRPSGRPGVHTLLPLAGGLAALLVSAAGARAQGVPSPAAPAPGDSIAVLREQLRRVEARLADIERKSAPSQVGAPRADAATVTAGSQGFILRGADGAFQLRLRGVIQSDGRMVAAEGINPAVNTFLMRRVRPALEGTMYRIFDFRIAPDFAQGTVTLADANVDVRFSPRATLRVGKFKPPVGLERLQSASDLVFAERGFPANLAPQRDVGVQLSGDLRGGTVAYALGAFNGAPDQGSADLDNGSQKDVAGRLFLQPFRNGRTALRGLGVGIAGSHGVQRGATGTPALPSYRSPAQIGMFSYRNDATAAGTTFADGARTRLNPQAWFYKGRVGVQSEYVRASQEVRRGTSAATLATTAWQVQANVLLTGEAASFRSLAPKKPFDPATGGWGAFEVGARIGQLRPDVDAFPLYANPATAVSQARELALDLTWHLGQGIKLLTGAHYTRFEGGAANGGDRPIERALLTRVQHAF